MKIFCKFPTVNILKLNFWLVICIAKNLIWTTLKAIFSVFWVFCTLRFQIFQILSYHNKPHINGKLIYSAFRWCINLNFEKFTLMTGFVIQGHILKNLRTFFQYKEQWKDSMNSKCSFGTHQADADELVATKADCGVGSCRQRLGPKLPWHTKPTLDTRWPSSTSVLYQQVAVISCTGSPAEQPIRMIRWPDWPTSSEADSTCRRCGTHTLRKLSRPTNKNSVCSWLSMPTKNLYFLAKILPNEFKSLTLSMSNGNSDSCLCKHLSSTLCFNIVTVLIRQVHLQSTDGHIHSW